MPAAKHFEMNKFCATLSNPFKPHMWSFRFFCSNPTGSSRNNFLMLEGGNALTGTEHIFLQRQANDLVLVYLPVPEPGLLFGVAVAVLGAGAMIRRRIMASRMA